jgi:hypothetical protein
MLHNTFGPNGPAIALRVVRDQEIRGGARILV